jgi:hemerythrin-like domain-containing protein
MKRITALQRLSKDHHQGLVLVLRARRAHDATAAWQDIQQHFAEALEPHFVLEEIGILPALEAAGETAPVERTRAEHQALRALVATGTPSDLLAFTELLEAHIRFEESALFETAQTVLSRSVLDEVEALHVQHAAPQCQGLKKVDRQRPCGSR